MRHPLKPQHSQCVSKLKKKLTVKFEEVKVMNQRCNICILQNSWVCLCWKDVMHFLLGTFYTSLKSWTCMQPCLQFSVSVSQPAHCTCQMCWLSFCLPFCACSVQSSESHLTHLSDHVYFHLEIKNMVGKKWTRSVRFSYPLFIIYFSKK